MKDKIDVCLDFGHGGFDLGLKTGKTYNHGINGDLEKDINLEIGNRLGWYLAQHDISYTFTRFGNRYVPLSDRVRFANKVGAKLFLSLHCNYALDPNIKGSETWCYHNSELGQKWAEQFNTNLAKLEYTKDRGVKFKDPSFYVLHHTSMPSILLELGFLSNSEDSYKLSDVNTQMIIANNLKDTIKSILGKGEEHPPTNWSMTA